MRRVCVVALIAACGGAKPIEEGEHVGAMPVPAEADPSDPNDPWAQATIDEVDTSVAIDDVKAVEGPWPATRAIAMGGRVLLALHAEDSDRALHLAVIDTDDGARDDVALGAVTPEAFGHTFDGNTYLSAQGRDETGPILFAVRVLPPTGAAGERRQVVVFAIGDELRVVEKGVRERAWRPRARLDFRPGTTFVGIGTTDPH